MGQIKTSVVIVAHNEEKNIEKCILSILQQTFSPGEIILVAHNCSDQTVEIASRYLHKIKIFEYHGSEGVVYARIKAFAVALGKIIACIDGDATADKNWLSELIKPLANDKVTGSGGVVWLVGSLYSWLQSLDFFFLKKKYNPFFRFYFWGANFACRKSDYLAVGGLEPLVELNKQLHLNHWADDLYLALQLSTLGKIAFNPRAKVYTSQNPVTFLQWVNWADRSREEDRIKLERWFRH